MKTRTRSSWMRTLGNLSYLLGVAFLIAAMAVNIMPAPKAYASNIGSIWTTAVGCNSPAPQDQNLYSYGQTVHIRGAGWFANKTVYWKVEGQPGSATPGLIASGSAPTDNTGYFCVSAHTVQSPEGGEYKYTVSKTSTFDGGSNKHDNYRVQPAPTATPVPSATPTNTEGPSPTPTDTPQPGEPTATPKPHNPPLIPVTGANLGGGWSTQTIFFNLGIGFLGLGLVLNGLARSRKEQDL
jgi:hypothetical protein